MLNFVFNTVNMYIVGLNYRTPHQDIVSFGGEGDVNKFKRFVWSSEQDFKLQLLIYLLCLNGYG